MKKFLIIFMICLTAFTLLACNSGGGNQSDGESVKESVLESVSISESLSVSESESVSLSESVSTSESESESASTSESLSESESESQQPIFCRITFDSNGGSQVDGVTLEIGSKITKPQNPVKSNYQGEYEFLGWYLGDELWDFENGVVTQDITLVAKWKLVEGYTKPYLPKN